MGGGMPGMPQVPQLEPRGLGALVRHAEAWLNDADEPDRRHFYGWLSVLVMVALWFWTAR